MTPAPPPRSAHPRVIRARCYWQREVLPPPWRGILLRPSPTIRFARPRNRVACYCGMVRRASSARAASHCHCLPRKRRRCATLASSPHRRVRAGCRTRKPGCDRSRDVRSLSRRGFDRARFHVRVIDPVTLEINDHLSELRRGKGRDHANRRLPVFFMSAAVAVRCCVRSREIAACSVPTGRFPARRFNNSNAAAPKQRLFFRAS